MYDSEYDATAAAVKRTVATTANRALPATLAALFGALLLAVSPAGAQGPAWRFEVRDPAPPAPLGPPPAFEVELVLDDGSAEIDVGVGDGATANQFMWFNRFTRPPGVTAFLLQEVWVQFPPGANMAVGAAVQLAVYLDPDGDPTNGAELLASYEETIQAVDGSTFSVYALAPPIEVVGAGDVLIGVVPRFIESGVTTTTLPASVDAASDQQRSWRALWTGDPPELPMLPPDAQIALLDGALAGNWMIRGYGRTLAATEIPTLGGTGLALLAALLVLGGCGVLRRRARR